MGSLTERTLPRPHSSTPAHSLLPGRCPKPLDPCLRHHSFCPHPAAWVGNDSTPGNDSFPNSSSGGTSGSSLCLPFPPSGLGWQPSRLGARFGSHEQIAEDVPLTWLRPDPARSGGPVPRPCTILPLGLQAGRAAPTQPRLGSVPSTCPAAGPRRGSAERPPRSFPRSPGTVAAFPAC